MSRKTDVYIVSAVRTAVGRAKKGTLRNYRPEDMAAAVIREAIRRVPGLEPEMVDDVIMGCAFPEGPQGLNMGRLIVLRAGLPVSVPGATFNRFCSSGLQAIATAAHAIAFGDADVIVAGGVESMSLVPMTGFYYDPHRDMALEYPEAYISMGNTAENVAEKFNISREDQDAFALRSHQRAIAAIDAGKFEEEIVPLRVKERFVDEFGNVVEIDKEFKVDESPRRDTSMEALARLKPVFRQNGTVTAGNSSPMNDGAAAAVVMSGEMVRKLGLEPMARFVGFAVAGVPPEIMGIGPVEAIPKVLKRTGLKLEDIDLIELNEAFAAQTLAVIRQLGLDEERVNVNGGAIALGHPLGATGAKLTATLLHEMARRKARYGIVTMCIGGGMGAAGIFENLRR